ncbi:hypothetical protein RBB50_000195 [Rhinocladiella similis]
MAGEVQAKGDGQQYHGSVLEILTIVLACVSVLVVTVRGVARHRISRIVESTDILLPVALVFVLAQTVFVRLAISNGLGRHVDTLDADQISTFEKLTYAANLLFQLVLALGQVIVVLLIKNVEPPRPVRIGCNCLLGIIVVYSALALAVLAFQCSLPTPWIVAADRCVDRQTFLTSFIVASIAIDAVTLVLPIIMMCKAAITRDKKIFVCVLFGTRIVLPLVTAPQIYHLRLVIESKDPTWDIVTLQTWVQVVMNLSIITASLPSLGKVMWDLWAFGSSLRASRSVKSSKTSKDFGHELGFETSPPQYEHHEKGGLNQPGPVIYAPEKDADDDSWSEQILHKVREIGSVESYDAVIDHYEKSQHHNDEKQQLQEQEQQQQHHQFRYGPPPPSSSHSLSRAPAPAYTPSGRRYHHYRRPDVLSPVIERSPYIDGTPTPKMPSSPSQHWGIFQHQHQQQQQQQQQHQQHHDDDLLKPPYSPRLDSPKPPSYAASSHYDDDRSEFEASEFDVDSYYFGNTNYLRQYDPRRTDMVLQSMIDDLQKENAQVDPSKRWEHGWI